MSGKYLALQWLRRILGLGVIVHLLAFLVYIVCVLVMFFSLDVFEMLFGLLALPGMLLKPTLPYLPLFAVLTVAYLVLRHKTKDKHQQTAQDQDHPKT